MATDLLLLLQKKSQEGQLKRHLNAEKKARPEAIQLRSQQTGQLLSAKSSTLSVPLSKFPETKWVSNPAEGTV